MCPNPSYWCQFEQYKTGVRKELDFQSVHIFQRGGLFLCDRNRSHAFPAWAFEYMFTVPMKAECEYTFLFNRFDLITTMHLERKKAIKYSSTLFSNEVILKVFPFSDWSRLSKDIRSVQGFCRFDFPVYLHYCFLKRTRLDCNLKSVFCHSFIVLTTTLKILNNHFDSQEDHYFYKAYYWASKFSFRYAQHFSSFSLQYAFRYHQLLEEPSRLKNTLP